MTPVDPLIRLFEMSEWEGDCLVYQGSGPRQYGSFRPGTTASSPSEYVHRYAYKRLVGPIPEGLEIDHVLDRGCFSTKCILPWHLEPVTHKENRRRSRLRTCRAGLHDLTIPENVRWDGNGNRRGCKLCHLEKARQSARRRYQRRRSESDRMQLR